MTRQKPALHASHMFADTEEFLAGRTRDLALEAQNTPRQPYRYDNPKMRTLASKRSFIEFQRDVQAYTEPRSNSPPSLPPSVPTSNPSPDFELVPATYDDIPELVQIHIEAYEYDQMTLLLRRLSGRSVEDYKRELIARVRQTWGETGEKSWTWVARRKSDGEALGCAVWVINNEVGKEKEMKEAEKDGEQTMEDVLRQLRFGPGGAGIERKIIGRDANEPISKDETPAPPRKGLNEYSHEKMLAMHERWVPAQTRYMCTCPPFPFRPSHPTDQTITDLGSLAVSSRHQSHGVGGALLHQGMSRADSEGLLIWLEATPAGHPVYEHYGWKTVESISVRLQDFVGNPREQSGWGTYRMSGCLRMPMLVEKEKEKGKDTRREEISIEEEEQRRADEAVGRKKREDDKWWNDEWNKMVSERKLKKEKEKKRRDALRESRKDEDKIEASKRFSEKRSEKKMDKEKEIQKEEAEGESDHWRSFRERIDE